MHFKALTITLVTALFSAALQAAPAYPVPDRYKALFERAFSAADYAIEVRSGNSDTRFKVVESNVVTPTEAFLEESDTSEWTVDNSDTGVASIKGVTFVYDLKPIEAEDSEKSHTLELLVVQTTPSGRHSSMQVDIELAANEWVELLSSDRSQGDVEQYAYIIVRLRDLESAKETGDDAD